jgi:hypothetical protein
MSSQNWTYTFRYPSTPGEAFASGIFDGSVGRTIRIGPAEGIITAATVAPDGRSVEITVRTDAPFLGALVDQDFHLEGP